MPIRLTAPLTKGQTLTSQEVIDFRLTSTIPEGVDHVDLLLADLDQDGGIMRPSPDRERTQHPIRVSLLDGAAIREPTALDDWLPDSIKALRDGAGLTNQQLLQVAFGTAKAWSYAVYADADDSPLLDGSLE